MWLIGIDEAGYGPNLGPLVIGATAWQVAGGCEEQPPLDLYDLLCEGVSANPGDERLAITDSKQLYKPGGGWRLLERGVLGALATKGMSPMDGDALLAVLGACDVSRPAEWRREAGMPLPKDATPQEIATVAEGLHAACRANDVSPPMLRARLVQPDEFNKLIDKHGTKGAALSHVTIDLLKSIVSRLPEDNAPLHVVLDKHGGRNRYASLIQHHFPEYWIEIFVESRQESRYRAGPLELTFRSRGESFLPTALASMTAKLLREIEMQRFNTYWQHHLPHLKPTAGYPLDARRFKAEIAEKQAELRIDDHKLWRIR